MCFCDSSLSRILIIDPSCKYVHVSKCEKKKNWQMKLQNLVV
jgi:hypothetical protein